MCGIVGYIGSHKAVPIILEGLKRLEYRGYDSAGLAVYGDDNQLAIRRAQGKLRNLEEVIRQNPLEGTFGIGHTRWATHGRPTEENAHPHRDCKGTLVVVHNGIIENYLALKHRLQSQGHVFVTETDTEVIAHLVESHFNGNLEDAVRAAVREFTGSFAMAVISSADPRKIVAARYQAPLVVGTGDGEYFVASDVPAILAHTQDMIFLADGDMAVLTDDGVRLSDFEGHPISRKREHILWDPILAEKGGYKHFMLKEIYEQPRAVRDTTLGRVSQETGQVFLDEMDIAPAEFARFRQVKIIACGTSWHAALAGKFMIEKLARLPVEVDYGSEFRYRDPIMSDHTLTIVISQSGETADTLAAIEATDEATRKARLADHARQVRAHLTALGRKSYWEQFDHAPEFAVLFLPGECFFSAALESDPSLIEFGVGQNIILATPTTLIALLRAVAYGWRQENLAQNAAEIGALGKELFKRLSDMGDHWNKMGTALERAVESYNAAVGSLEARVLVTARKFADLKTAPLGVEIAKLEPVEKSVRAMQGE